ncbi:hypothetical protein RJT11_01475 [Segatella copri]|uniref:hypothetical protein n=1 Tax=Segatella copri TaxID=165179 RepID=UPI00294ADBDE|nr:hypothetical protein [Segatella copri]WOG04230.1 hypothetical protein RJT11_01475 [Segatella copri]
MGVITRVIRFLRVGVGISNADLEYAESTSQTTAPTEGWQTTAPKWRKDYYIWSRTHIYYTDGNEKVSTPMCLSVARSIDRIEECYYSSTSSTAITGGAWVKGKSPAWVNGRFIWTKSIIYYTDGTSTETTPICCTGGQGPQGPQGKPGENGKDGKDGTSISITGEASAIYDNCAALQAALDSNPTCFIPGDYPVLLNTSSDASSLKGQHGSGCNSPTVVSLSVQTGNVLYYNLQASEKGECYIYNGDIYNNTGDTWYKLGKIQGPQGEPGTPGKDGADAVQYYYHIAWCNTPDNSDNSFSTSCSDGDQYAYMGTCNNTTKEDPEDFSAYEWVKVKGADGAAGKDAINIQLSMLSIVHKKSQFVGSYSIDVQAFRAGEEITCGCGCYASSDTTTGISIRGVKYKMGRRILITIEKNAIVNDTLVVEVSADKTNFIYKIPFRTVEDGEPGAKGEVGATLRGPQSWANCGNGYNFECGASGEEWKDVVFYNSGFYSCIKSHIKSAHNYPGSDEDTNNGYWRLGSPIELVIANIILTQYQLVDNLGVKVIEMSDKNGKTVFLAKDGKVICKSGTFENVSVSGDISVGRLRYNENTVTDGKSVINGSFIRGAGTYILPHLTDGEFMRIVVFNPIITRSTPPTVLKGEQTKDAFMAADTSFSLNRETTIEVYGWCELIGTNHLGNTMWVYHNVKNNQIVE